jgi:hypothetical protein
MRRRPAAVRYGVSCAALAVLVVMPVVTMWVVWAGRPVHAGIGGTDVTRGLDPTLRAAPPIDWLGMIQAWAVPVWACGDPLTADAVNATIQAVRGFDPHLEASFDTEPEGVFLRIHTVDR